MRLHGKCWLLILLVGIIIVFVWLNRDLADEEEVPSDVTSTTDQGRKKNQQFKLIRREQARRVKHIQDICNDWKDAKQSVKQVIKYTIKILTTTQICRARAF